MKQISTILLSRKLLYLFWSINFLVLSIQTSAQVTCIASGNWSSPAIWSPSTPTSGQTVTVAVGCTLNVDVATPQIGDLTIDGTVIINSNFTSDLIISGKITINSSASLENNGSLHFNTSNKAFIINGNGTYLHNPLRNILSDESIFYNGLETFSPSSTLNIKKWFNGSVPLGDPTRVATSDFGNLILDATVPGNIWDQDGYFSIPTSGRVKGSLTVSKGTVVMDDGTGNTTSLILQSVLIDNTGNIVFQKGSNRNLTLTTGNFTLNSIAPALPTIGLDTSFGILNWNVNGNIILRNDFYAINGGTYQSGGDVRITVSGNLDYNSGKVIFVNRADSPLRLTVNGNTTLSNASGIGSICFIEGGTGSCTFTTTNFNLTQGSNNYLLGTITPSQQYKGTGVFNINNDLNVTGNSGLYFAYADSNTNKIRVNIIRDFNLNGNATVNGAFTSGAFTFKAGRNFSLTSGKFIGQNFPNNNQVDSIVVGTNFIFNSLNNSDFFKGNKSIGNTIFIASGFSLLSSGQGYGQGVILVDSSASNLSVSIATFSQTGGQFIGILSGSGNLNFNCSGLLQMNSGIFKGTSNTVYSNAGGLTFNAGSIDYSGGYFSCYYNVNNSGSTGIVNINGGCSIRYNATSDEFNFIGLPATGFDINNLALTLSITGALSISGADGRFVSSRSLGAEIVTLGSLVVSAGTNSFNCDPNSSYANGHNVTLTVSGNISISGGNTFLSANSQTLFGSINGGISIVSGSLTVKGGDCTTSTLNVMGGYSMTGGDFFIHNAAIDELSASSTITININSNDDNNGDFVQSGGNITFDNCATTPAALNLIINVKSPNYSISGNGNITMTKPGTGLVYGNLNFARNGVINFNRSGSHLVQQVKQTVNTGCVLDIVSGDIQLASNNSVSTPPQFFWINNGGTVDAHSSKFFSNNLNSNSGITVLGRLKTSHPQGLYNGTINATFSTNISDNFDYYLATTSIIEYNGSSNQMVTGIGIGKALLSFHKYGNLEINFQGTPNTTFAYLTNLPNDSAVSVRTSLILTNGELNLDGDHNPSNGGGRKLTIESGLTSSIQRSNGYLRSETENNSALLKWNLGGTTGAHIIPFGFSATEYIPFTFNLNSGTSPNLNVGTYHTLTNNTPLPPTVTHVRNNLGVDNSSNTVDRFWFLQVTGSSNYNSNLTFTATPAEIGSIGTLKSQRWISSVFSWTNPPPGTQTSNATGNATSGITDVSNWWALSGNNSPLPVELIFFAGHCESQSTIIEWSTATEKNNDHFDLEKSYDGIEFSKFKIVNGNGTSSIQNDYSVVDDSPYGDLTYYRLTQFDFDGVSKVYPIIAVKSCKEQNLTVSIVNDGRSPQLIINSNLDQMSQLKVVDINGKEMFNEMFNLSKGMNVRPVDLSFHAAGVYFLKVQTKSEAIVKQFFLN